MLASFVIGNSGWVAGHMHNMIADHGGDCFGQRKATVDELWAAAKVCRMPNVMRPYMEAVT